MTSVKGNVVHRLTATIENIHIVADEIHCKAFYEEQPYNIMCTEFALSLASLVVIITCYTVRLYNRRKRYNKLTFVPYKLVTFQTLAYLPVIILQLISKEYC